MLSDLMFRLRSFFWTRATEAELDDELRFHAAQQRDKYVQSGMTFEEATRRVRLEFGGLEQVKESAGKRAACTFWRLWFKTPVTLSELCATLRGSLASRC